MTSYIIKFEDDKQIIFNKFQINKLKYFKKFFIENKDIKEINIKDIDISYDDLLIIKQYLILMQNNKITTKEKITPNYTFKYEIKQFWDKFLKNNAIKFKEENFTKIFDLLTIGEKLEYDDIIRDGSLYIAMAINEI